MLALRQIMLSVLILAHRQVKMSASGFRLYLPLFNCNHFFLYLCFTFCPFGNQEVSTYKGEDKITIIISD